VADSGHEGRLQHEYLINNYSRIVVWRAVVMKSDAAVRLGAGGGAAPRSGHLPRLRDNRKLCSRWGELIAPVAQGRPIMSRGTDDQGTVINLAK